MRRFFFIFSALSISAWSQQPAPAPAQAPIVVQVQMPPTNPTAPWVHFLELILPVLVGTGLGAGLAFYSVSRTNKHNSAEIAAKYRSQDRRWEFRKDVYVNFINATTSLIRFYVNFRLTDMQATTVDRSDPEAVRQLDQARVEHWKQFRRVTDASSSR
jgi:hypothetical protein